MHDYKRRKKNILNSSAMQRALRCTCSLKFAPSLIPPNPNQFCDVTWPLLPLPSSPISLSLLIVVIFLFSCVCKVLFIMPPHFHFLHPYSLCLFLVCNPLLLFMPSPYLRKSVCSISCCLILPLPHLLSHLTLVADCCIYFLQFLLPLFSLFVYCHVVFFQKPKTNSPSPLYVQGYRHWEAWDFLPDCLAMQVG